MRAKNERQRGVEGERERERERERVRESESQRETKKRMIVLIGKSLIANRICVPGREKHERVDG